MKRSEINAIIREAIAFLDKYQFRLPPFAYFTPEEWKEILELENVAIKELLSFVGKGLLSGIIRINGKNYC